MMSVGRMMPASRAETERITRKPSLTRARQSLAEASLRRRRILLTAVLLIIVLVMGYADYITGPDIGFSLFYLAPIVVGAWYGGRRVSAVIAVTAAACWFLADYLIRVSLPISLWNGITRLVIYVGQGLLVGTLREDRRREAALARTDSVTHLPNSRSFRETLEAMIEDGTSVGVLYIDLDNFKRVNDLFGHAAGDEVLQLTAGALRKAVRATDVVARVGGDEFAVVVADADSEGSEATARRIIEGVARIAHDYAGTGLGASVGVVISNRSAVSAEDLIRPADDAMYEAKQRQKGSYVVKVM